MSMLAATVFLAQLQCAPNASGTVDCFDAQKGGAPVVKVEKNLFGGYDVRREDGTVERCEVKPSGEMECRVGGRAEGTDVPRDPLRPSSGFWMRIRGIPGVALMA